MPWAGLWPTPAERRRPLRALAPATACPMDGDDPLGTDHGVMVVQDEPDRLLLPHAAASGNGEEARQCLQRGTDRGLTVTAAFSDYCQSFTAASTAVGPPGRLCRPPIALRSSILGGTSKNRGSPTAGSA